MLGRSQEQLDRINPKYEQEKWCDRPPGKVMHSMNVLPARFSHTSLRFPGRKLARPENHGTRFQERTIPQFCETLFHSIARKTFANGHVMSVSPPASDMQSEAFSEH